MSESTIIVSSVKTGAKTICCRRTFFAPVVQLGILLPGRRVVGAGFLCRCLSSVGVGTGDDDIPGVGTGRVGGVLVTVPSLSRRYHVSSVLSGFREVAAGVGSNVPTRVGTHRGRCSFCESGLLAFGW